MTERSNIEWTDSTWNPWVGCTKVSPGCDNCYAQVLVEGRFKRAKWGPAQPRVITSEGNWALPEKWNAKQFYTCDCGYRGTMRQLTTNAVHSCGLSFRKARRRVFCASLSDVFDNEVPEWWRAMLFDLIERTPNLDWLLLTKRIGNVPKMLGDAIGFASTPKNVWLGITVVNQEEANRDIPKLLCINAHIRFLSIEPMLDAIDLTSIAWAFRGFQPDRDTVRERYNALTGEDRRENLRIDGTWNHRRIDDPDGNPCWSTGCGPKVNWVICGGESGPGARPMHPDWARSLRDQCNAAAVPFFFKQWGEWEPRSEWSGHLGNGRFESMVAVMQDGSQCPFDIVPEEVGAHRMARVGKKAAGRLLDGREWSEFPKVTA